MMTRIYYLDGFNFRLNRWGLLASSSTKKEIMKKFKESDYHSKKVRRVDTKVIAKEGIK